MDTYRPRSAVVSTTIDEDESVLLHLERQQYYSLNETGSHIWQLLTQGHDAEAIVDTMTEEWTVSFDEARRTVRVFLEELREEGLVRCPGKDDAGTRQDRREPPI